MTAYSIVPEQSVFWVRARSGIDTVTTRTGEVTGSLFMALAGGRLDLSVPPTAEMEIAVRSLSSGNPLYDRELQRRVDGRRHPAIRAILAGAAETGEDGRYRFTGEVSFRGHLRTYAGEATLSQPDPAVLRIEGEHRVDMRDFGVAPPRLVMVRVDPELRVGLVVTARSCEGP